MQNSVPKGEGGMVAVLGSTVENIEKILIENKKSFIAQIANDNSDGQIVLSGKKNDLEKLSEFLKEVKIKNITLPVSAPFHWEIWIALFHTRNQISTLLSDMYLLQI